MKKTSQRIAEHQLVNPANRRGIERLQRRPEIGRAVDGVPDRIAPPPHLARTSGRPDAAGLLCFFLLGLDFRRFRGHRRGAAEQPRLDLAKRGRRNRRARRPCRSQSEPSSPPTAFPPDNPRYARRPCRPTSAESCPRFPRPPSTSATRLLSRAGSDPTTVFVPRRTVTGRSVFSRTVRHGTPR